MASSSSLASLLLLLLILPLAALAEAIQIEFDVDNQCNQTLWAAAFPGGGQQMDPGETFSFTIKAGTLGQPMDQGPIMGRVWARTGCSFDANGKGHCKTGDCGGQLVCQGYGDAPNTVAQFVLDPFIKNIDIYGMSRTQGFNVPMAMSPYSGNCKKTQCLADVESLCPAGPLTCPSGSGYKVTLCP